MKVHDEHLSKEDKQVVADEAEAERKFQAEKQAAGGGRPAVPAAPAAPEEKGRVPSKLLGKLLDEAASKEVVPLAPPGTQILREVLVGQVTHYYIIGLAAPYVGAAQWIDILPTRSAEETRDALAARLLHA